MSDPVVVCWLSASPRVAKNLKASHGSRPEGYKILAQGTNGGKLAGSRNRTCDLLILICPEALTLHSTSTAVPGSILTWGPSPFSVESVRLPSARVGFHWALWFHLTVQRG